MYRLRRKSTRDEVAPVSPSDTEEPRRFRMKADTHDTFIKLCVDNFEIINDTSTAKGTPTSAKVKSEKVRKVWQKITSEMNKLTKVIFLSIY